MYRRLLRHMTLYALWKLKAERYSQVFCIESCSDVMNLCAERAAGLNMYMNSGQTVVKHMIAFMDKSQYNEGILYSA